jgi:hypothetical protein
MAAGDTTVGSTPHSLSGGMIALNHPDRSAR